MIYLHQKWCYANYFLPLQQVKKNYSSMALQKKSEKSWKNCCMPNQLFIYNLMVGEGKFESYTSLLKIR